MATMATAEVQECSDCGGIFQKSLMVPGWEYLGDHARPKYRCSMCDRKAKKNPEAGKEAQMPIDDIEKRFTYHPPKEGQPERYEEIRGQAKDLAYLLVKLCPPSRDLALALTKLEEAVMWANAAIARNE